MVSEAAVAPREQAVEIAAGEGRRGKPAKTLTRKAGLNAVSALLDYLTKAGVTLVLTPLLVGGLGQSLFGLWQMLYRLVSVMITADGRPTQALKWVIANQQSIEDDHAKRRHVGSAIGVWLIFLPALTALGGYLVWVAPFAAKVSPELHATTRITCALLVANFLLTGLIGLPEAVLRGMNLGYKRMGLVAGLNLFGGGLTAAAVFGGWGLVGIGAAQMVLTVLTALVFWAVVRRSVRWFGVAWPCFAEVWSFLKLSTGWLAWGATNKLLLASDVVVLGMAASTSMVATYTLNSYAAVTVLGVISLVIGAVTPGLGGVIGERQYGRAVQLWSEMKAVSWLLAAAAGSTILLWNRSFLALWVGEQHYAGVLANFLIVLTMAQFVFIRTDAYVIGLTLKLRSKVVLGVAAVALSLLLSAALIPRWGIAGLCVALLLGRLVMTLGYPRLVRSYLDAPRTGARAGSARAALTLGGLYLACAWLGQWLMPPNWAVWLAGAAASSAAIFALALYAGLAPEHRGSLVRRVSMLKRKGLGSP